MSGTGSAPPVADRLGDVDGDPADRVDAELLLDFLVKFNGAPHCPRREEIFTTLWPLQNPRN